MNLPTYPRLERPTIAGLIVTGRLAPPTLPPLGRHAEGVNPQAVTVAALLSKVTDLPTVAWFDAQLDGDTVRLPRIIETTGGAA